MDQPKIDAPFNSAAPPRPTINYEWSFIHINFQPLPLFRKLKYEAIISIFVEKMTLPPNGFTENHAFPQWFSWKLTSYSNLTPPPLSSSKLWMVFYTYNLPTIATVRFIAHGDVDMYDAKVMQYWSQLWEHWLWMKLF